MIPLPEPVKDALPLAHGLVHYYEQKYNGTQSGEFKRGQVYGQMKKKYTEMSHYDIGLAIELAMQLERGADV